MSAFDGALEWQDRADHARRAAGQLTDPVAKQAMLQAAKGYEHLARAAAAARKQQHDFVIGTPSDLSG
jgi:hypothetical protein